MITNAKNSLTMVEHIRSTAFAEAKKKAALVAQRVGVELEEPAIGFAIAEQIRKIEME